MIRRTGRFRRAAFTLVELLVVVSIIALLISILLPSLKKARQQAKAVVCLSNLKSLGTGVMVYACEYNGVLPGPLHPAVYRNQTLQVYLDRGYSQARAAYFRSRQITWKLHTTLGQKFEGEKGNITDDIATCPVLLGIVPDKHFEMCEGELGYYVFPTHYVLNNIGDFLSEAASGGHLGNPRTTVPAYYFGYSPPALPDAWTTDQVRHVTENPPRPLARIRRPSDEWAISEAWYRERPSSFEELQQAGPYQSGWSGVALPHFAPHFKPGRRAAIIDEQARKDAATSVDLNKTDGKTDTVFFDGHAGSVKSKTLWIEDWDLLYGFTGTVNPLLRSGPLIENWPKRVWK